jgi:hypothetical protein
MSDDVVVVPRRFLVCVREHLKKSNLFASTKGNETSEQMVSNELDQFQYVKRGFGDPIDRRRRLEPFHRDQQAYPITIANVPTSAQRQVK